MSNEEVKISPRVMLSKIDAESVNNDNRSRNMNNSNRSQSEEISEESGSNQSEEEEDQFDEDGNEKLPKLNTPYKNFPYLNTDSGEKTKYPKNVKNNTPNSLYLILMVLTLVVLVFGIISASSKDPNQNSEPKITLDDIRPLFPSQKDNFWLAIQSGVQDITTLNRPSSFIFLYQNGTENKLRKLVEKISKFALCELGNCSSNAVVLNKNILNSPEILQDYGLIISKYGEQLREKPVMIVENLHQISGKSAQAFHSLCDEFTPLVAKSMFIFTLNVPKFGQNEKEDLRNVETILFEKWSQDIKKDIFDPLFTRISGMPVRVYK